MKFGLLDLDDTVTSARMRLAEFLDTLQSSFERMPRSTFNTVQDVIEGWTEEIAVAVSGGDLAEYQDREYRLQDKEQLLELINCVREALDSGEREEFLDNLESLLEICQIARLIGPGLAGEIVNWAHALDTEHVDLLYSPSQSKLIIPELILRTQESLLQLVNEKPEFLFRISPREFEEVIAELLYTFGYSVELTAQTRDGGRDIIAIYDNNDIPYKLLVECKRHAKERRVGIAMVQRLLGVKIAEHANKALLVTTSTFTKPAKVFEQQHFWDLALRDYEDVMRWISAWRRSKYRV